ncbi:MAG: c-type cytochrome domain-containing protein, partial [Actinomycetota bacterium]
MPPSPLKLVLSLGGALIAGAIPALAAKPAPRAAKPAPPPAISFEQDVRPVLKAYCFDCHGGTEKVEASLDLRLKRFIAKGGNSGHALVPGKPGQSVLIQRMKSGSMP